jgi:hypothetical protein
MRVLAYFLAWHFFLHLTSDVTAHSGHQAGLHAIRPTEDTPISSLASDISEHAMKLSLGCDSDRLSRLDAFPDDQLPSYPS